MPKMNPYIVLGLEHGADAKAANMAFIRRMQEIREKPNARFTSADLEWALLVIERSELAREPVETFRIPTSHAALLPPAELPDHLPLTPLDRRTTAGNAMEQFEVVRLAEVRRLLVEMFAAQPEAFRSIRRQTRATTEETASLRPFGTWTNEQIQLLEQQKPVEISVVAVVEESPTTIDSVPVPPIARSKRRRFPGILMSLAVAALTLGGLYLAYISNQDESATPNVTSTAVPAPSATTAAPTPAVTATPTPAETTAAKPSPQPTPTTKKSSSAPATASTSGPFSYRISSVVAAAEGGSDVDVAVTSKKSCDVWQASLEMKTDQGRERAQATAYDFKNPSPNIVAGRTHSITFHFTGTVGARTGTFKLDCAG